MPCRDYDLDTSLMSSTLELRERCDMLSRIACKALAHIEESGDGLEILVLKDPEIQEWWSAHKAADAKAAEEARKKEAAAKEKERLKKIRKELMATLTPDQKKALRSK